MHLDRRSLLLGSSALGLTAALSACRATDTEKAAATSAAGGASGGGTFPATIKHKFGSTTVTAAPKRVVCVGYVEQDMLLALGIVPVAVSEWLKGAEDEIYPWARPLLGDNPVPEVLPTADGIPMEKIAALKPDLIVGVYQGMTAADYKQLSEFAPTVAQPKEYVDWGAPWDVNALTVAKAVGRPEEGKKIVDKVKKRLADEKKKNADLFGGTSAAVVSAYEGIYVYGPQDPRERLLQDLGFAYPDSLRDIGGKDEFGGNLSPERTREIDLDTVIWVSAEDEAMKSTGNLWKKSKAHQQGRTVYIPYETKPGELTTTYSSAFSFLTPVSIPYLLDSLIPQLQAAADGDPKTKVPGPKEYEEK